MLNPDHMKAMVAASVASVLAAKREKLRGVLEASEKSLSLFACCLCNESFFHSFTLFFVSLSFALLSS